MKSIVLNTTSLATYNKGVASSAIIKKEENNHLITKQLTSTNGQEVELTYSEKDRKTAACVIDIKGDRVAIKAEDMPKELREIHDPITFNAFLRDTHARTSSLSNGDIKLYVNHTLNGGMINQPAAQERQESAAEVIANSIALMKRGDTVVDNNMRPAVLIVGKTGAGKSTLVNYLAGVELTAKEIRGDLFIDLKQPRGDSIKIGHSASSETTIPNKWISNNGTIYWDCPGFEETRSVSQDIANAYYIKRLFDTSQNVKVVIVIADNPTDPRETDLVRLVDQLTNLVPNKDLLLRSLSLVVTKTVAHRTSEHIKERIESVLRDNNNLSNLSKDLLRGIAGNLSKISLFKRPQQLGDVDGTMRASILAPIEQSSFVKPEVKLTIADQSKLHIAAIVDTTNESIKEKVQQIVPSFRQKLTNASNIEQCETIKNSIEQIIAAAENPQNFCKTLTTEATKHGVNITEQINSVGTDIVRLNFCKEVTPNVNLATAKWKEPMNQFLINEVNIRVDKFKADKARQDAEALAAANARAAQLARDLADANERARAAEEAARRAADAERANLIRRNGLSVREIVISQREIVSRFNTSEITVGTTTNGQRDVCWVNLGNASAKEKMAQYISGKTNLPQRCIFFDGQSQTLLGNITFTSDRSQKWADRYTIRYKYDPQA